MNKKNTLIRSTVAVSAIVVVCKLLGFVRETIIASIYGATWETDAFFMSQSMPGLLFPAVCSSISTAFISLYVEKLNKNREESDKYASKALLFSILLSLILGGIGVFCARWYVPLLAPGFSGEQLELTIKLTKVTMGSFSLIMIQYLLTAVLNANKSFVLPQISGIFYNVIIIALIFASRNSRSMYVLTFSVIGGLVVQVLMLLYSALKVTRFSLCISNVVHDSMGLLRLSLPIIAGNCAIQINNIVDKMLSSNIGDGAMSALSYASSLVLVVKNVIITTFSTVLFPNLTDYYVNDNHQQYRNAIQNAIYTMVLILTPITIITYVDAEDIVSIAFGRGSFDSMAIERTSSALAFYSLGFLFTAIREILTRAFYAKKDSKTPMINGIVVVVINIIASVLLVRKMGLAGIALGTSIAALVGSVLLYFSMHMKDDQFKVSIHVNDIIKVAIPLAIVVMTILTRRNWFAVESPLASFLIDSIGCAAVYFIALLIMREKESRNLLNSIIIFISEKGRRV